MAYDPIQRARAVESIVCRASGGEELRKYYRFRPSRFYGGSAVADAVGCCLSCAFCWSWKQNSEPTKHGDFYSANEVAEKLLSIARARRYRVVRVSGGEPTLCWNHLLKLLEALEASASRETIFVLETNGILIGLDRSKAKQLAKFEKLFVRVSIKGCDPDTFERITGAKREFWRIQLRALENLLNEGVPARPAVMASFCSEESLVTLSNELREIDEELPLALEIEYVILYPSVASRLKRMGLEPRLAIDPRTWMMVRGFG